MAPHGRLSSTAPAVRLSSPRRAPTAAASAHLTGPVGGRASRAGPRERHMDVVAVGIPRVPPPAVAVTVRAPDPAVPDHVHDPKPTRIRRDPAVPVPLEHPVQKAARCLALRRVAGRPVPSPRRGPRNAQKCPGRTAPRWRCGAHDRSSEASVSRTSASPPWQRADRSTAAGTTQTARSAWPCRSAASDRYGRRRTWKRPLSAARPVSGRCTMR